MKIYDGGTSNSPIIGSKLCGTNVPQLIASSSNELLIQFHSDDNDVNGRYRIKVESGTNQNKSLKMLVILIFKQS